MGARRHLGVCILAIITTLGSSIGFGQDANSKGAVLIFLDDLHIEFRNTPRLRTGLRQAVERVLAAGRDVAIVSDGPSSVAVRPTKERALLLPVANRISGGGLKAEEMADPTPATAADIRQREAAADTTLQGALGGVRPEGILYVTERPTPPLAVSAPVVITRPEGMDSAAAELLSVN